MATPAIRTDALTKRYRGARGIEGVTLTVGRGEAFGFLGANGAGKTTFIRTLVDLLHPTSGRATVLGLDSRRDSAAVRARCGALAGDFACDPRWTGRTLIGLAAAVRGLPGHGIAAPLAERLQADLDRPLGELSRGNRQKIGLIQALFHEPELVILDEPTAGLDPLMQEEFVQIVHELRRRGTTVFLSSHNLAEVQHACERVAIIRAGRLLAVEDVAALRHRAAHRIVAEFADVVDPGCLERLPGVRGLRRDGRRVTFDAAGALDPVLQEIARHPVVDLSVTEPTLEDLFLAAYEQEPAA